MNHIFYSFFLSCFLLMNAVMSFGADTQPDADTLIKTLKENPDAYHIGRNILKDDATSIGKKLMSLAKSETDLKSRYGLLSGAIAIEEKNRVYPHPKYRSRSSCYELLDLLVEEFELERGRGGRIPSKIYTLFHTEDLKKYSQRIRAVIHSYPEQMNNDSLVLYANLPDNSKKEELEFVNTILSAEFKNSDAFFLHALRARLGDKKSEQALLDRLTDFWKTRYDGDLASNMLKDVLLCAGTEKVMEYVALHIQSKNETYLPGRILVREDSICRDVLREKYQDDSSFPLPANGYSYTDQEVSGLKKWCEKNLKVKYPAPTPAPSAK